MDRKVSKLWEKYLGASKHKAKGEKERERERKKRQ